MSYIKYIVNENLAHKGRTIMPRLKVIRYDSSLDANHCEDENGKFGYFDLVVSGCLGDIRPEELIGKTISYEWSHALVNLAEGVKIIEDEQ